MIRSKPCLACFFLLGMLDDGMEEEAAEAVQLGQGCLVSMAQPKEQKRGAAQGARGKVLLACESIKILVVGRFLLS